MSEIERLPTYSTREGPLWRRYLIDSVLAILGSLLITGIIFALHLYPSIPNISLTYILLVLALGSTRGLFAAVVSSLVAFLSFDFFPVPPFYRFTIARPEECTALLVFSPRPFTTGHLPAALHSGVEHAVPRTRRVPLLMQ